MNKTEITRSRYYITILLRFNILFVHMILNHLKGSTNRLLETLPLALLAQCFGSRHSGCLWHEDCQSPNLFSHLASAQVGPRPPQTLDAGEGPDASSPATEDRTLRTRKFRSWEGHVPPSTHTMPLALQNVAGHSVVVSRQQLPARKHKVDLVQTKGCRVQSFQTS